jgi:anti-sigma factor RsiW
MITGYVLRDASAPPIQVANSLPRQAAVAHAVFVPEVRHPVEVGADQQAHLVGWLSKRLGAPLKPPQLDEVGYQLVGGRLLPGDSGEVAQFMYENAARNRLTLYIRPDAPKAADTAFRYARENGIDVFYWTDSRFGYALSGNTGREDMLRLATLVFQQHGK